LRNKEERFREGDEKEGTESEMREREEVRWRRERWGRKYTFFLFFYSRIKKKRKVKINKIYFNDIKKFMKSIVKCFFL
jgi:hypothetical protein